MSIFSIYTGLLYNEFFSIPTSIFGASQWACATDHKLVDRAAMEFDKKLCPSAFTTGLGQTHSAPFPIGIDPAWHGTRTELTFLNSIKMKLSIILGELSTLMYPHWSFWVTIGSNICTRHASDTPCTWKCKFCICLHKALCGDQISFQRKMFFHWKSILTFKDEIKNIILGISTRWENQRWAIF